MALSAYAHGVLGTGNIATEVDEAAEGKSWQAATTAWAAEFGGRKLASLTGMKKLSEDQKELEKFTDDRYLGSIPKLCRTIEKRKFSKVRNAVIASAAEKFGGLTRTAVPHAAAAAVTTEHPTAKRHVSKSPKPIKMLDFLALPPIPENATINSRGRWHNRLGRFLSISKKTGTGNGASVGKNTRGRAAATGARAGNGAAGGRRRTRRAVRRSKS